MIHSASVDQEEIKNFARLADQWWDPEGPMKPLHQMNPLRLKFIRDHLIAHFHQEDSTLTSLKGLSLLDVGSGAGLLTEPLARLGAAVTGLDLAKSSLAIARNRSEAQSLDITYLQSSIEEFVQEKHSFHAIMALEVIEHVADVHSFLQACASLLRPKGLLFLSTLNRTPPSYLTAILGAEYILRLLPRGTHQWHKFLKPSEVDTHLHKLGFLIKDLQGMRFRPLYKTWKLSKNLSINYILCAEKIG
jgi:2-polyprenyl-6-hydroxyphenyl methylase/3-demethylubiquinone-9 3-methyltransferase